MKKDLGHDRAIAGAAPDSVNVPPCDHTPGPWWQGNDQIADEQGYGGYLWSLHIYATRRTADDNNTKIAWIDCRDDSAQDNIDAPRLSTAKANARLIAAAPEMLVALQEIIWASDEPFTLAHVGVDRIEAALTKARAAIAKATGVKS